MPANWATLPRRWECKAWHAAGVRCRRCQIREQVYGDLRAERHGGVLSMANRRERARWWTVRRRNAELMEHRALAVQRMADAMKPRAMDALAICGPREWVAWRCWARVMGNQVTAHRLLACAEAFTWERHGPSWGMIVGGVAHTDSGMLSAVARCWLLQAPGMPQAVMFPRATYSKLRRLVPLLLEPAQPWLVRYSWRAAREWERLRVKRLKAEAAAREAQIDAIRAAEEKSLEQPPP